MLRDGIAAQRDESAEERDIDAGARDLASAVRDRDGRHRDHQAGVRDEAGIDRDHAADQRDQRAELRDRPQHGLASKPAGMRGAARARRAAASDREHARQDRGSAGADRYFAELDRDHSGADRGASEHDRGTALTDRGAGGDERTSAASDRARSFDDRDGAAADRHRDSLDELTGAYLRRPGLLQLERDLSRAERNGDELVVAFVDVDHLKAVNDHGGHAAGDRLLQDVVQTLRAQLRPHDLIIRFGGDEFVCVVAGSAVGHVGQRLTGTNTALAKGTTPASITVGLAHRQPGDTAQKMIERADRAMYEERARRHRPSRP